MGHTHVRGDRGPNRPAYRDDMSDGELELDDVEDKLEALLDEGRKKQRAVKYHILRRQMTPPGAPQRMLTWDAIEQIRYLKKEDPEEWTVERLAEGFSVAPDVILRVLRSNFIPSPDKRAKQDAKVMARVGQQLLPSSGGQLQDKLKLPGNRTPATLPPGNVGTALVPATGLSQMIRGKGSGTLLASPIHVTSLTPQVAAGVRKDATEKKLTVEDFTGISFTEDSYTEEEEDEDSWDGCVLTEEELEEYLEMEKPAPVVQVGNDFFDAEGNFLYRV